jgi:RHS repeat-associated protein
LVIQRFVLGGVSVTKKADRHEKTATRTQYTAVDAQILGYDSNGNLTSIITVPPAQSATYVYDAQNRLISATHGTNVATFAYDPRNRCVSRTINGVTTYFVWDGWSLIEEHNPTGALDAKYVRAAAIDEILTRYGGSSSWYRHDGLGSTTHLTDNTGAVVETYRYDAFGAVSVYDSTGSPLNTPPSTRFTYTGREYLADLSLYDYRNRVYSQSLGRCLQTDPIRFEGGDRNLYRYAGNRPLRFIDPLGLKDVTVSVGGNVTITISGKKGTFCAELPGTRHANCNISDDADAVTYNIDAEVEVAGEPLGVGGKVAGKISKSVTITVQCGNAGWLKACVDVEPAAGLPPLKWSRPYDMTRGGTANCPPPAAARRNREKNKH